MSILRMDTAQVLSIADHLQETASLLQEQSAGLVAAVRTLPWSAPGCDAFMSDAEATLRQIGVLAGDAAEIGQRVRRAVAAWEEAATFTSSGLPTSMFPELAASMPVPGSAPTAKDGSVAGPDFSWLSDLFGTIDLASEHAPRQYDEAFEQIGRWLNNTLDTRGYIKVFGELGEFLRGTAKAVSFVENVDFLYDSSHYYSGELTNAEYLHEVCNAIPVPFLGDRIHAWVKPLLQFPDNRWGGLVRPAY